MDDSERKQLRRDRGATLKLGEGGGGGTVRYWRDTRHLFLLLFIILRILGRHVPPPPPPLLHGPCYVGSFTKKSRNTRYSFSKIPVCTSGHRQTITFLRLLRQTRNILQYFKFVLRLNVNSGKIIPYLAFVYRPPFYLLLSPDSHLSNRENCTNHYGVVSKLRASK